MMKDSGVEWIGEIPEGWEVRKIRHIAELNGRIGWQGLTTAEYIDEGPFLITGTDFINGIIDWKSCVHIPLGRWEEANQIQITEGDLLITKDGTVGKVALATNIPDKASLNSGVLLIRNDITCEKKYLFWILNSYVFWKWFGIINSGNSTIIHLYQYDFYGFKFPFPPKETQEKIATYLDEKCSQIEQTIQNQQQVIEKLKAYKQSLITEAVTGKVKIQTGKVVGKYEQYKDSGVEWIGEIPSRWEAVKFKYLGKFIGGYAFPSTEFSDIGIKVIKIANIQPMKVSWEEKSFVTEKYKDLSDYQVCKGDLIFALTRPIINGGIKTAIFDEDDFVLLNQRNAMFKGGKSITSKWQFYLMQHKNFIQEFEKYIDGTGQQPNISTFEIQNIAIPLPEIKEQNEIAEYLDKTCTTIDSAIEQKQKLIEKLTEYRKSLIYECVTGKKEVNN